MWKIISLLLPWFIGTIIITQVIVPLILRKDMFWLFRKKKKPLEDGSSLEVEISSAQDEVTRTEEKVAGIKNKANENYEEAKKLKKKADSI